MAFMIVKAQPPSRFYTKFGGTGDDIGYSAKPTLDRQYIVAGSTSSFGSTDVYLVKVDSMGLPIWSKTYGGINNEVGKSVIQLSDSGYVIAGFTSSFGAGGYDVYLVRTDKYGNLIWQRTFGGNDWDFANDLVLTSNGNIAVVGNTSSFGSGQKDGMVLIYDLSGNIISQKFYGGSQNEELRSIIKTNDGFLATVGYTESKNDINGDGYFLKLDLMADTLFTRTFGGPYRDFANDLVQKNNGDYFICGAKTYSANAKTRSYKHKINYAGSFVLDSSRYNSVDDECYVSNANSTLSNSLTAFIRNLPVPQFAIQGNIMVADPTGFEYAVNSFGGTADEMFFSIENTPRGGYVMVAWTQSFKSLGLDIFFIKIDDAIVIDYTSIVNITETFTNQKPLIFAYDEGELIFRFAENKIPRSVSILDINGILIKEYTNLHENTEINISDIANSLYLIRLNFNNGESVYNKLIKY